MTKFLAFSSFLGRLSKHLALLAILALLGRQNGNLASAASILALVVLSVSIHLAARGLRGQALAKNSRCGGSG
jgi:hypothetical protein